MYLSIKIVRMRNFIGCFILGIFILSACNSGNNMTIKITDRFSLDQIPSASGIEYLDSKYWIIGDNSPWLYEVDDKLSVLKKHVIFSVESIENGVIPKKVKHDFEAMTSMVWDGDSVLFIFGSGSKAPHRNQGLLVRLVDPVKLTKFDLSNFYELILEKAKLKEDELNIEAAAVMDEKLYLFNRGKNKLIIVKIKDFQNYILGKKDEIKIKVQTIDLPQVDGIQAGFSGATADEKHHRLLFTASVENTSNWVDDGAVLGSFVGVIDVAKLHYHYVPKCELLTEGENTLPLKAESISVKFAEKKHVKCLLVTDSDGGESEALEIDLTF